MKKPVALAIVTSLLACAATFAAIEVKLASNMSEELRASVASVVVLASADPGGRDITGSYADEQLGIGGGMSKGSQAGRGVDVEVGPVPVNIPIPILTLPGAIIGGVSGAVAEQVQELRDALTEQLAEADSSPLTTDALAMDVFWNVQKVSGVDSKVLGANVKIPEETDAVLYVNLENMTIDVDRKDAVLTIAASATLRRKSDGTRLHKSEVSYQDRDSLKNWTRNDNALFRNFANYGRHYLGREIAAEIFDRTDLHHSLKPKQTKTVSLDRKNEWAGVTKSAAPELAWEVRLADDSEVESVYYDLEIYDLERPVYSAERISGNGHTVSVALECKTYRWSVRPTYRIHGNDRRGNWMRSNSGRDTGQGSIGLSASTAPAYIYDFATLKVKC